MSARRTSSSTSTAYPPSTAPNTDPVIGGGSASRTASVRLRAPRSSAAASVGAADRSPMVAADPAYTPASSGSTERATTCSPNRSPTRSATAGSAPGRHLNGRARSSSIRAIVASSTSPASADGCAGMPCRVPCGIGCSRRWL